MNDISIEKKTKYITFAHHKGGTGKTTACINISGYLTKTGKKVLLVDLDPQGNATSGLGVDKKSLESSMYEVLIGTIEMKDIILETDAGIHLAPATLDLVGAEAYMYGRQDRATIVKRALKKVESYYDYIMIDTPSGPRLFGVNGIVAADYVIVSLDLGVFALEGLEDLHLVFDDIKESFNVEINAKMTIITKFIKPSFFSKIRGRQNPVKEIEKEAKKIFEKVVLIPYSTEIYESQLKGIPISNYAPKCKAGLSYEKIANEIASFD